MILGSKLGKRISNLWVALRTGAPYSEYWLSDPINTPTAAEIHVSEISVWETRFVSPALERQRLVRVCAPASYHQRGGERFPVLYLHDGQNMFSVVGDQVAFGWGNWALDQTTRRLAREGRMREIIMVSIDCAEHRYHEYRGPSPGRNDAYARYSRFLIDELKPWIDRKYRTLPEPETTGVMGSSMGGICSLSLAWEHPRSFGLAASLSGAFQVERSFLVRKVLGNYRGAKKPFRVYLDSGVADLGGGDDGRKHTEAAATELRRIGWREGEDLMHFVDDRPLRWKHENERPPCAQAPIQFVVLARGRFTAFLQAQPLRFHICLVP